MRRFCRFVPSLYSAYCPTRTKIQMMTSWQQCCFAIINTNWETLYSIFRGGEYILRHLCFYSNLICLIYITKRNNYTTFTNYVFLFKWMAITINKKIIKREEGKIINGWKRLSEKEEKVKAFERRKHIKDHVKRKKIKQKAEALIAYVYRVISIILQCQCRHNFFPSTIQKCSHILSVCYRNTVRNHNSVSFNIKQLNPFDWDAWIGDRFLIFHFQEKIKSISKLN